MTRVLLTGGSGFIASHILELLLQRGHVVVTTVRSQARADEIKKAHPGVGESLEFAIVEDIAVEGAFDKVVQMTPFDAVLHTASPYRLNVTDVQKELIDPAINGTTGILRSIKTYAPSVKRIVITSSFASIIDPMKGARPEYTYSEKDWNPITLERALAFGDAGVAYLASKKLAEQAAWDFVEKEKPNFTISTICAPTVFGPIRHLHSLDAVNTSNERIRDFIQGKMKDSGDGPMPPVHVWVDVRDVALAHVNAMEKGEVEAQNKRFLTTAGHFSNQAIANTIRKNFPEYKAQLPPESWKGGYTPEAIYNVDASQAETILGIKWLPLETSIIDTVKSLKGVGA